VNQCGSARKPDRGAQCIARGRIHFKLALARPDDYEKLMARMKAGFFSQGKEGILKARAVEDRLMRDSWQIDGYDLLPKLRSLGIPPLVMFGDRDFIPSAIAYISRKRFPMRASTGSRTADTSRFWSVRATSNVRSMTLFGPSQLDENTDPTCLSRTSGDQTEREGWCRVRESFLSHTSGDQTDRTRRMVPRPGIVPESHFRRPDRTNVRDGAGRGNRTHTPTEGNRILSFFR
jgi:hypothetical protein